MPFDDAFGALTSRSTESRLSWVPAYQIRFFARYVARLLREMVLFRRVLTFSAVERTKRSTVLRLDARKRSERLGQPDAEPVQDRAVREPGGFLTLAARILQEPRDGFREREFWPPQALVRVWTCKAA